MALNQIDPELFNRTWYPEGSRCQVLGTREGYMSTSFREHPEKVRIGSVMRRRIHITVADGLLVEAVRHMAQDTGNAERCG